MTGRGIATVAGLPLTMVNSRRQKIVLLEKDGIESWRLPCEASRRNPMKPMATKR